MEQRQPDIVWCTFDDFALRCEPDMSMAERKIAWAKLVKEKALQTLFDVHRFNARNRGSFVMSKTDGLHTEVTKVQR